MVERTAWIVLDQEHKLPEQNRIETIEIRKNEEEMS